MGNETELKVMVTKKKIQNSKNAQKQRIDVIEEN